MIAFDTNYLVRHIVQDDAEQCRIVANTLRSEIDEDRSILIADLVLMETYWVLQNCYGFSTEAWCEVLNDLLHDAAFCFENPKRLRTVLRQTRTGKAGFPDFLILATAKDHGADLKTFDKPLLKHLSG